MKKSILFFTLILLSLSMANCTDDEVQAQPFFSVAAKDTVLFFANSESIRQITIQTNVDWTVSPEGEAVDWCVVSPKLEEGKTDKLRFDVLANEEPNERETFFIIKSEGMADIKLRISQLGVTPVLHLIYNPQISSSQGDEVRFNIVSNIDYTLAPTGDWFHLKEETKTKSSVSTDYVYTVDENWTNTFRTDTILVRPTDPAIKLERNVLIKQAILEFEDIFPEDIRLKIKSATLTRGNTYGSETIDKTIDSDRNTIYSSSSVPLGDSVIVDYILDGTPALINYLNIVQRADGNPGSIFNAGSVWFQDSESIDWELISPFDVPRGSDIAMDVSIIKPTKIRLILKNTEEGDNIAFAELELYELKEREIDDATKALFVDDIFSALKPSTTEADIANIQNSVIRYLATELLNNSYDVGEFRVNTFKAQRNPRVVSSDLKIGSQSVYDNPTGIVFVAGEAHTVFIGENGASSVNMVIRDFRANGGQETIVLKKGINIFTPNISGEGFIQYYTDDVYNPDGTTNLPDVDIHFYKGHEIGFWDIKRGDTNDDYVRYLQMARKTYDHLEYPNGFFSVSGKYAQLLNTLVAYEDHCATDIESVIVQHDSVLSLSYDLMGLTKNNIRPKNNRKLNLRTWSGPPNWNGVAANYPNEEAGMLDINSLVGGRWWVYGHELGHGNQIKPHMHMPGWGECSNNIYASYVTWVLGGYAKLEMEIARRSQSENLNLSGERFNSYINEAHVAKKPYLTHVGQDYEESRPEDVEYIQCDHFVKLAPLWQLTLYFHLIGEGAESYNPNFWGDVNWDAINDDRTMGEDKDISFGKGYVNFMKRCIESSGYDLSSFFEKAGLLKVVDHKIADYRSGRIVITESDVAEIKNFGATKEPLPTLVLSYISLNSLDAFKNKRNIEGSFNTGITSETKSGVKLKKVDHNVWENVVAYETYQGNELIDITITGVGSPDADNSFTYVRYPDGATRIEAVAWDGTKTLVFGAR